LNVPCPGFAFAALALLLHTRARGPFFLQYLAIVVFAVFETAVSGQVVLISTIAGSPAWLLLANCVAR
jgi:hypothetical protein